MAKVVASDVILKCCQQSQLQKYGTARIAFEGDGHPEVRKKRWHSILQRSIALCDFDQHVESYGAQRVVTCKEISHDSECGQATSAGSTLLHSAAEVLEMTYPALLEELGAYYERGLRSSLSLPREFASGADYFSVAASYYNSCSWILEAIVAGTLQVTKTAGGWLKIQCAFRENSLWAFFRGFLLKILGGVDGPATFNHEETITAWGVSIHLFMLRNGAALEPEHRTGSLVVAR